MKRINLRTILFCIFLLYSFAARTQNNTIDSLKKVLQTQQEDTIKIKNLFSLGRLYFIDNRYDEGLRVVIQARALSEKVKFDQGKALYLGSMVIFHRYNKMYEVFRHLLNPYYSKWNIEADYFIQIKQSNSEPDFQLVKSQLFKALNSFHPANDKEALANIHAALFYRFLDEKKLDSALLQGKIAEGYYDDLNKREEAFQIMLDKIAAYAGIDNKEALQNEEFHAIDYITNTTDKRTRAHLYEQMGFNYDLIRRRSSLIQCFLKAKELWEELDDKKGQINAWHQLGVYQVEGAEKGFNYFLKELSIRKEIKDSFEINETYSILTYACIGLGRLEDAENYVLLAKNSIEHNANPFVQARLLDAEGQLLQAKKMYPEAISKFKLAAELFSKTGFVVHLSYQYYHLAKCYQAMGNLAESFRNANHAFDIATQENWTDIKIGASLLLSELYAQSHNIPKAYEYLKLHKTIKDEWDSKDEISRAADFETQSILNQHQRKIDLLEKNNILAEVRSSRESLHKNLAFAGIGVIFLAGAYGFYRFRKRKKLQSQQALMNERLRISRELHDEVGATLSGIAMYSHLTKEQIKNAQINEVEKSLNIMQQSSGEMVNKLNDIVWLINPDQDSLQKLIQRLEEYATDMAIIKNIQVKVTVPAHLHEHILPVESRRNIYLFCKEAINNAVKYSEGSLLELNIKEVGDKLEFSVSDNGKGFDAVMVRRGNGLENMQKRADEIGAKLLLQSKKDEGSLLSMQLKIT